MAQLLGPRAPLGSPWSSRDRQPESRLADDDSEWYDDYSGLGNEVLYRMCREEPGHKDIDIVASKLWLIGRAYAATLERRASKDFQVVHTVWLIIVSDLDENLNQIMEIDRADRDNLGRILEAHCYLADVLAKPKEKGCTDQRRRSFASKHLHFHASRAFFIYDSISCLGVEKILNDRNPIDTTVSPSLVKSFDPKYRDYALKILHYRDPVLETQLKKKASPRRIGMELQRYHEQRAEYALDFTRLKSRPLLQEKPESTLPSDPGIILPRPEKCTRQ